LVSGTPLPYVPESEPTPPIQTAGDSPTSQSIERYLSVVLAGFADLVSDLHGLIRMTASPEARAANMDPWTVKNGRRIRLVEKKHREGLNDKEEAELARLKREVYDHIQAVAPRPTDVLDEIEARIDKLKRKVEAKRGERA
jgi:hypothetical protein